MNDPKISAPQTITEQIDALNELCKQYPTKIPVEACAKFLGISGQALRAMIEGRRCPFGLGWLREGAGNRAFIIPTLTFYLWVTTPNGSIFQARNDGGA